MTAALVWFRCLILGHDWRITPCAQWTAITVECDRCGAVPEWRTR